MYPIPLMRTKDQDHTREEREGLLQEVVRAFFFITSTIAPTLFSLVFVRRIDQCGERGMQRSNWPQNYSSRKKESYINVF